ncbi:MAG: DUF2868 domain-containing protein [Candidatus Methylomirabilia bacterium]
MRESALREVLLVKAIEEADRTGALLPFGDRERAAREALRTAGLGSGEIAGGRLTPAIETALAERAGNLAQPLLERHPVLRDVLQRSRLPVWASLVLLAAAFAAGIGLSALDGSKRINILAPPVLGLLLWNFLVYLGLAIGAALHLRKPAAGAAPSARVLGRWIGRRIGPLLAKTAEVDTLLGAAVRRFAVDWSEAAAPLLGQHLRRWLHVGAAAITAGLIAGLYLRGLVLRYEAGWESTFLEPPQVKAIIDLLFGRIASMAGIPLPQTIEQVAGLRWDGVAGGGAAAPWIHLIALGLTTIVVLPRLALAAIAWLAGRRLQLAGHLPPHVAAYARFALGAGQGQSLVVSVTPYAFEPLPGTAVTLAGILAPTYGGGVQPELRAAIAYGDESSLPSAFDTDAHRVAGRVLLMNLAATPETENHGAAIVAARDHARRARPGQRLLVVLDGSTYASRFAAADSSTGRLEERRRLWQTFVAGYGVEVAFTHDAGPAPQTGK